MLPGVDCVVVTLPEAGRLLNPSAPPLIAQGDSFDDQVSVAGRVVHTAYVVVKLSCGLGDPQTTLVWALALRPAEN
jgi:hypothetical protein